MLDWNSIGQYVLLFLIDGVAGYILQLTGYSLAIHAFNKKQITARTFIPMTIIFSVFSFAIRSIPNINFGYHTILIVIMCTMISCILFKTSIYSTVLAVLLTTVSILIFEALTFGVFFITLGCEKFNEFFIDVKTTAEAIRKALMGVPINILLVVEMYLIYNYFSKKSKKDGLNGGLSKRIG